MALFRRGSSLAVLLLSLLPPFLLLELNQMSLQGIAWNEGSIPTAPYYPTFPAVGPLPAGKDVRFDSSVDKGELNSSHHPFLAASPFLSSPF